MNTFDSLEEAEDYAAELVTHTQSYFCFGNLDENRGLATQFGLKIMGFNHVKGENWGFEKPKFKTKYFKQFCSDAPGDKAYFCVNLCDTDTSTLGRSRKGRACKPDDFAITIVKKRKRVVDMAEV